MAAAGRSTADLGSLFGSVTGRSTVVEHQRRDRNHRVDEGEESPLAAYLDASARADGLDDAIDDPGPV
mgnify:CR=1 FL=1